MIQLINGIIRLVNHQPIDESIIDVSWLMAQAQGSCLPRGSRLMAKKNLARGPEAWGTPAHFFLAMRHERRAAREA